MHIKMKNKVMDENKDWKSQGLGGEGEFEGEKDGGKYTYRIKIQGVPSQILFKESIYLSFCAENLCSKNFSEKVLLQFLYAKD